MENINRGEDDPFYRYKMPKLQSKIEGNGNGIKTVIPNMRDIAKALGRSPEYTTKFFGFELGAQTIINDRFIVNGAHQQPKLADLLDVFIKKFVLCPGCGNPETDMIFKSGKKGKEKDLYLSCKACGKLSLADPIHKLTGYIIKNPPSGAVAPTTPSGKKEKKEKDPKKKKGSDEDPETSAETSGEIMEREPSDLDASIGSPLSSLNSDGKRKEDPTEVFAKFLSEGERNADELALEASKLDLNLELAAAVVIQVLLESNLTTQFKKHKDLLKTFAKSEKEQKGYLGGLERLVSVTHPELLPKTSQILKLFYDNDVLEEEVILSWFEKPSKKFVGDKELSVKVREAAQTMVEWLKNAEEESEEEGDD